MRSTSFQVKKLNVSCLFKFYKKMTHTILEYFKPYKIKRESSYVVQTLHAYTMILGFGNSNLRDIVTRQELNSILDDSWKFHIGILGSLLFHLLNTNAETSKMKAFPA